VKREDLSATGAVSLPGLPAHLALDDAATAVTTLYQDRALDLIRLAYVMLSDRPAAEDVAQEAFCALYRRFDDLAAADKARQHVRTSVLNGCRSVLRHRAVRKRRAIYELPAPSAEAAALGLRRRPLHRASVAGQRGRRRLVARSRSTSPVHPPLKAAARSPKYHLSAFGEPAQDHTFERVYESSRGFGALLHTFAVAFALRANMPDISALSVLAHRAYGDRTMRKRRHKRPDGYGDSARPLMPASVAVMLA
jgi:hypothetical protein